MIFLLERSILYLNDSGCGHQSAVALLWFHVCVVFNLCVCVCLWCYCVYVVFVCGVCLWCCCVFLCECGVVCVSVCGVCVCCHCVVCVCVFVCLSVCLSESSTSVQLLQTLNQICLFPHLVMELRKLF